MSMFQFYISKRLTRVCIISGKINFPINRQGQASKMVVANGHVAGTIRQSFKPSINGIPAVGVRFSNVSTSPTVGVSHSGRVADIGSTSAPLAIVDSDDKIGVVPGADTTATSDTTPTPSIGADDTSNASAARLSPRLEMRLALNHDILDDEDLIGFDPGPKNLAAILGRDLSSYHRFTGRDLISRSASRIVPKEAALISYSQQKNSKMDTPIPNRKKANPSTWNNSASVDQSKYHFSYSRICITEECLTHFTISTIAHRHRKSLKRPRTVSETREDILCVSVEDWSSGSSAYKTVEDS